MSAHILIVEDERKISDLLADYLKQEGMQISQLYRGDRVAAFLRQQQPDLILLDLQLPGCSGIDVCRDIRQDSQLPIIMVTARVDEIDRLLGLELGADDYICKPFSPREVVARVKAVLRRAGVQANSNLHSVGRLRIDQAARQASIDEHSIELTPVEFEILSAFVRRPRDVLSRQQLLQISSGQDYEGYTRNIDSHMKNLRRKLRQHTAELDPFRTVYGIGYGLNMDVFK